ncbi:hypothetical protein C5D98_14935 [Rathayibacter rathayi]|uniref:hypothetical protein n=1 Tax=Rathayibacter rathayi TaxID=33887 RepID=UPI000CE7B457|nr:hypothetical protein [Rathayibacter rathayi]PPG77476.1 hypothetical protein C5C15_09280 [Rathayibacter rathayi]PPG94312.1 hypothetical protein C5C22_09015 [Rathayibacter rathayi]PPI65244.1 hypothetical protein C5D98_14935 [Rathayibacter rathayi]
MSTDDRLSELRDLIAQATHENEQLRQEQLELLPAVRASKASITTIAAAFGISRAAFYKRYNKIGANSEGDPARGEELLERIRELEASRAELTAQIGPWRQERDAEILNELAADEKPKWSELAARAGVSEEWISRLKQGKAGTK